MARFTLAALLIVTSMMMVPSVGAQDCVNSVMVWDGDTLFGLAAREGVDAGELAAANNLSPNSSLKIGDVLCLDGLVEAQPADDTGGPTGQTPSTDEMVNNDNNQQDNNNQQPPSGFTYLPEGRGTIPRIGLQPTTSGSGQTVTVNGSNFPPNTEIDIYIERPFFNLQSEVLGTVTTDGNGNFTYELTVPDEWPNGTAVDQNIVSVSGYATPEIWGMNYFINTAG